MMYRIPFLFVVLSWLVASQALAQETVPGTGEVIELRSDDARCPEGFRCFVAGPNAPMRLMLGRVNADIADESRHVTVAQFLDANPCMVIFRRADGEMRHNGSCSFNGTRERIIESEFCADTRCQSWIMASSTGHLNIYRVPAERALTPSERAEQMVETLNAIDPVTDTVPTPVELIGMLTELDRVMEEPQPPSEHQVGEVVHALVLAHERTRAVATAPPAVVETPPAPVVIAPPVAPPAPAPTPVVVADNTSRWPWWVLLISVVAVLMFVLGRKTAPSGIIDMTEATRGQLKLAYEDRLREERAKWMKIHLDPLQDLFKRLVKKPLEIEALKEVLTLSNEMKDLKAIWKVRRKKEYSFDDLRETLAVAFRFEELTSAWRALTPAYAPTGAADGGLPDYIAKREEQACKPLHEALKKRGDRLLRLAAESAGMQGELLPGFGEDGETNDLAGDKTGIHRPNGADPSA